MFIGTIHTPWTSRLESPRQGRLDGPVCRIEVFDPWVEALDGLDSYERIEVLYWLHLSRRDLVRQSPEEATHDLLAAIARGHPIATAIVGLEHIDGASVWSRGLDCLDGTPVLDLKPDRTLFVPSRHPKPATTSTTRTTRTTPHRSPEAAR